MPTRRDRSVPRRRNADDAGVHINFITSAVVGADGKITVRTRGSNSPQVLAALPGAAGQQLTAALIDNLHISGGTWTSSATLVNHHSSSSRFLAWLRDDAQIDDLFDKAFDPGVAWQGVLASAVFSGHQRNFRTFLADTLAALREDGEDHRSALTGRALPIAVHDLQGYSPEVATAIEKVARRRVGGWYQRHRQAVRSALGDIPRNWLTLPAAALIASQDPDAFVVTRDDLAAAMVLLALIDDKGPNLSVILSHTGDSFERAGEDASFSTSVKARNRQVLRTPAPAGGLFSYGGLLEFVTAATTVERNRRDDGSDFARLLFVATGDNRVLNTNQVNSWWGRTLTDWPATDIPRPDRLSFPRLRKAARLRGHQQDRVLVGQGRRTARLYLADALPDVILIPGLLDTQNSVTAYWREQNLRTEPDQMEAAAALTASPAVMDVGVAMCASNGQSPVDDERPCGLGPVACFVCPNGYRTPEVIPGLLAAVQFTDNIRKYEPVEWLSSEAPVLNTLAQKALDQFPGPVVAAASDEDVHNARALIACVYLEGRRRD